MRENLVKDKPAAQCVHTYYHIKHVTYIRDTLCVRIQSCVQGRLGAAVKRCLVLAMHQRRLSEPKQEPILQGSIINGMVM